jgi:hypothetical protein
VESGDDDGSIKCLFKLFNIPLSPFTKEPKCIIPGIPNELLKNMAEFYLFVHERHRIWLYGDESHHSFFQYFSLCNVYRELDRGTAYFHEQILRLLEERPTWTRSEWIKEVLWRSFVYRQVNRVETFKKLGGLPALCDLDKFRIQVLRWPGDLPFFTGAHQTTNYETYVDNLLAGEKLLDTIVDEFCDPYSDPATYFEQLKRLPGISHFLGWQILCDLQESNCITMDTTTFCILGPGAKSKSRNTISYVITVFYIP